MKIKISTVIVAYTYFCLSIFTVSTVAIAEELIPVEQKRHTPADLKEGRKIYDKYCKWCHGINGNSLGAAKPYMFPPPRDFTFGLFKYRTTKNEDIPLDSDLMEMVRNGINYTAHPAFKDILKEDEIWKVVGIVKSFSDDSEMFIEDDEPYDPEGKIQFPTEEPPNDAKSIAIGREIFYNKARCVECHGQEGRGNGKPENDDWGNRLWPRDLTRPWTFRFGSKANHLFRTISTGIVGTPMPSFIDALTVEERWHIAHFEMSLQDLSRKPTGEKTILSKKFDGELLIDPEDKGWDKIKPVTFPLVGQTIVEPKLFDSWVDNITVRSIYNDEEFALLLIWGDRTDSPTKDDDPGSTFNDAMAVEFPMNSEKRPTTLGMGEPEHPVYIINWNNKEALAKEFMAFGASFGIAPLKTDSKLTSKGFYRHGLWKVVIKARRDINLGDDKKLQFQKDKPMPVSFAVWDGSNGEKGAQHTVSDWYDLVLE